MGKKGGGGVRVKQIGRKTPANPLADLMQQPTEPMIMVPRQMDSSITHILPQSESYTMGTGANAKYKTWPCIWPTYIDGNKSTKEGRRIAKSMAVENPSVQDISEVLQSLNVRHAAQPFKGYPRDVESRWYNPGRILYDIEQMQTQPTAMSMIIELADDDDGDDVPSLGDEELTQKQCWRLIASKIESMPGRKMRLEEAKRKKEEEMKKASEDAKMRAVVNSKKQATTTGSSKKKGKKKK